MYCWVAGARMATTDGCRRWPSTTTGSASSCRAWQLVRAQRAPQPGRAQASATESERERDTEREHAVQQQAEPITIHPTDQAD
jgi:hypothetical protein